MTIIALVDTCACLGRRPDGRVRLAQAAVGYSVGALDKAPDTYANVARVIHDALTECASDVRAARQIKGQPGRV